MLRGVTSIYIPMIYIRVPHDFNRVFDASVACPISCIVCKGGYYLIFQQLGLMAYMDATHSLKYTLENVYTTTEEDVFFTKQWKPFSYNNADLLVQKGA